MCHTDNIKLLLQNKSISNNAEEVNYDLLHKYQRAIKDNEYFSFICNYSNGGFFFKDSLQFYAFTRIDNYENIETVNNVFLKEYGKYAIGLCSVGQDVFGNQFVFDLYTRNIYLFNLETASKEKLGNTFKEFIERCFTDIDYYSGRNFILNHQSRVLPNQRLCPKKPFIIGGEYKDENFYASDFPRYFEFFADLAKQIHDLPDGTPIKLKIQ